jgi:dimethylamine/trimethylamine dehydrogenase
LHEIGNGFILANNDSLAEKRIIECDHIVLVTDRISQDSLYYRLLPALETGKLESLKLIGDAEAPNIIAQAVYSGHKAAQTFENPESVDETPFEVEGVFL